MKYGKVDLGILTGQSGNQWEFRQSSKPTVRQNGSALVSGDRWYDTTNNNWWFWNGTYWLSEQVFQAVLLGSSITVTTTFGAFYPTSGYNVYLLDLIAAAVFVATQDASNYWQFQLDRVNNANPSVFTNISTINANNLSVSSNYIATNYSTTINTQIDLTALNVKLFRFVCNKVGSAGTLGQFTTIIRYRLCQV